MKNSKNKRIMAAVLTLTMAMAFLTAFAPSALAQQTVKTFAYINAIPNPVGVNQEVLLHTGILTPHAHGYGWDVEVIITKPDGSKETMKAKTDSTGGTGVVYVPNQVGTYKVQTHFPQQTLSIPLFIMELMTLLPPGTIMQESYSDVLELIVQKEPVPPYPSIPLPSEYWTRPVDSQLRAWSAIGGNWLYGTGPNRNVFAPNNDEAPETPHILWSKVVRGDIGALIGGGGGVGGGEYDDHGYKTGDAYEGEWSNPIIISGILYYNKYWSSMTYDTEIYPGGFSYPPGVVAVDLHTGEVLWERDDIRVDFGMIYYYSSSNQHGAVAYIVDATTSSGSWKFYRAFTGRWEFTIENVPTSGHMYYGPNGEIMRLIVDTQRGWMALWNSTHIPWLSGAKYGAGAEMWRPYEIVVNGADGFMWNVSIPKDLGAPGFVFGLTPYAAYDDRVVGISWNYSKVIVWGLSLKRGEEGRLLFKNVWTPPADWSNGMMVIHYAGQTNEWKDGAVALFAKEERRFYGFSTEDGRYLWRTEPEHYLNAWGWGPVEHSWYFAYGHLYSVGVSGILYCYDLKTGKTLWTYEAIDPYNECLWNKAWWMWLCFFADGKVYMGYAEHSPLDPKFRGGPFVCVDAYTGEEVWRANGMFMQSRWGGRAIIGDSIMVTLDHYDSCLYAVGKGPTAVTVDAPLVGVPLGSSVVIRGTVMDVSPGTKDSRIALRFPKGVPAVADESMAEWMRYVYKQFPLDVSTEIKGVWVSFDAVDPDGKWVSIGGTITEGRTGTFSIPWKPDKPGLWTIVMTFPGSKSYYPSSAVTTVLVEPAPEEPTPATAEQVAEQAQTTQASLEATQAAVAAMQPLITALLVIVIICICLVAYDIYINRKMLRRTAK